MTRDVYHFAPYQVEAPGHHQNTRKAFEGEDFHLSPETKTSLRWYKHGVLTEREASASVGAKGDKGEFGRAGAKRDNEGERARENVGAKRDRPATRGREESLPPMGVRKYAMSPFFLRLALRKEFFLYLGGLRERLFGACGLAECLNWLLG
jgi:hypothetical protein